MIDLNCFQLFCVYYCTAATNTQFLFVNSKFKPSLSIYYVYHCVSDSHGDMEITMVIVLGIHTQ